MSNVHQRRSTLDQLDFCLGTLGKIFNDQAFKGVDNTLLCYLKIMMILSYLDVNCLLPKKSKTTKKMVVLLSHEPCCLFHVLFLVGAADSLD